MNRSGLRDDIVFFGAFLLAFVAVFATLRAFLEPRHWPTIGILLIASFAVGLPTTYLRSRHFRNPAR